MTSRPSNTLEGIPLTRALEPLANEQGYDLTKFAQAEAEFERKFDELRDWVRSTSEQDDWLVIERLPCGGVVL